MRAPREDADRVGGAPRCARTTPPSIARSRSDGAAGAPRPRICCGRPTARRVRDRQHATRRALQRCAVGPCRVPRIRRPEAEARVRVGRHRMPGDRGRRAGWRPPAASSQTSHPAAGAEAGPACRASIRRRAQDEHWRRFLPTPTETHDPRPSTSDRRRSRRRRAFAVFSRRPVRGDAVVGSTGPRLAMRASRARGARGIGSRARGRRDPARRCAAWPACVRAGDRRSGAPCPGAAQRARPGRCAGAGPGC